jgi:hypothetical protein
MIASYVMLSLLQNNVTHLVYIKWEDIFCFKGDEDGGWAREGHEDGHGLVLIDVGYDLPPPCPYG